MTDEVRAAGFYWAGWKIGPSTEPFIAEWIGDAWTVDGRFARDEELTIFSSCRLNHLIAPITRAEWWAGIALVILVGLPAGVWIATHAQDCRTASNSAAGLEATMMEGMHRW